MKANAPNEKEDRQSKSSAETARKGGVSFEAPGQQVQQPQQQKATAASFSGVAQLAKWKWQSGGWALIALDEDEYVEIYPKPKFAEEGDIFDDQTGELSSTKVITSAPLSEDNLKRKREVKKSDEHEVRISTSSSEEVEKKKLKPVPEKGGSLKVSKTYELGEGVSDSKAGPPIKFFFDNLSGKAKEFYDFVKSIPTVTIKTELYPDLPEAKAITKLFVKIGTEFVNTEDDEQAVFNQWHLVNKTTPMQLTILFDPAKNKNYIHTLENLIHEFTVHATYYRQFIEYVLSTDNTKGEVGLAYFSNNNYEQLLSGYHQHHQHFVGTGKLPEFKDDGSGITKEEYDKMKQLWAKKKPDGGTDDFNDQIIRFAVLLKRNGKAPSDLFVKAVEDINTHKHYNVRNPNKEGREVNEKETSVVDESSIPFRSHSIDELLNALVKGAGGEMASVLMGFNEGWVNVCETWLAYLAASEIGLPGGIAQGEVGGRILAFIEHNKLVSPIDPGKWLYYPGPENLGEAIMEHIALKGDPSKYIESLKEYPAKTLLAYVDFRIAYGKATGALNGWADMTEFILSIHKK